MNRLAKRNRISLLVTVIAVSLITVWLLSGQQPERANPPATGDSGNATVTLMGAGGLEAVRSDRLADWVGVADHVVYATVTGEKRLEIPESETVIPGQEGPIGREVSVQVSEVIWSAPDAAQPAPEAFDMAAFGWMKTSGSPESEFAMRNRSRLEVGQSYVIALVWKHTECGDPNDTVVPAGWSQIGGDGVLPANDQVIGVGEVEGVLHEATEENYPGPQLAVTYSGQRPGDLKAELDAVTNPNHREFPIGNPEGCPTP